MLKISDRLYDLYHEVKELEDKYDKAVIERDEDDNELERLTDDNDDLSRQITALEKQLGNVGAREVTADGGGNPAMPAV